MTYERSDVIEDFRAVRQSLEDSIHYVSKDHMTDKEYSKAHMSISDALFRLRRIEKFFS